MQWAASTGVAPLLSYPYTGADGTCLAAFQKVKQKPITGAVTVDLSSANPLYTVGGCCCQRQSGVCTKQTPRSAAEAAGTRLCLVQAMLQSPVAISIWADDLPELQFYSGGVCGSAHGSTAAWVLHQRQPQGECMAQRMWWVGASGFFGSEVQACERCWRAGMGRAGHVGGTWSPMQLGAAAWGCSLGFACQQPDGINGAFLPAAQGAGNSTCSQQHLLPSVAGLPHFLPLAPIHPEPCPGLQAFSCGPPQGRMSRTTP